MLHLDLEYVSGIPYITDCVMGELEKMGNKYRVALKYVGKKFICRCKPKFLLRLLIFPTESPKTRVSSDFPASTREHMLTIVWLNEWHK